MHERAGPADAAAWIGALGRYIADNTAAFRAHAELFAADAVTALERDSLATLARLRPLLVERGGAGLVRRGHGDLHLGNIAVIDGEPVAFDALEFDPVIASGDLLYDLAFLLMDLVERDLKDEANAVLNGYFAASRRDADCDGIAAVPFFMSLRSAIRANVTAARLELVPQAGRAAIGRSARRYFNLADELLQPAPVIVVGTGGLSGTGKSVLARALAPGLPPAPGALVLRSDVERKALYNIAEHERLPETAYRTEISDHIYRGLNDKATRIARAGHSVIVDAVFARPDEREAIARAMSGGGAKFRGLFLTADLATRIARVGGRGADASDADATVARRQEDFAIGELGSAWTAIDATGTPDETLARAKSVIGSGT